MGGLLFKARDFWNNISKIDKIYKSKRKTAAVSVKISAVFFDANWE